MWTCLLRRLLPGILQGFEGYDDATYDMESNLGLWSSAGSVPSFVHKVTKPIMHPGAAVGKSSLQQDLQKHPDVEQL